MRATRTPDQTDLEREERLYLAVRERAPEGAHWPHRATIELDGFEPLQRDRQWPERAALGLFASLAPDPPLSRARVRRQRRGHRRRVVGAPHARSARAVPGG